MAISHFYCYSFSGQMNWQIYPLVLISSGQEWQFHIATVIGHLGRSTGRSTPWSIKHRCLEYCYTKLTITPNLADLLADPTTQPIEHRCLEYCYTNTPNLADLPPTQAWISGCHTEKYTIWYQSGILYCKICISGIEKYGDCTVSGLSLSLLAKGGNNTQAY